MPVGQKYDFLLNGKGYLLARGQYAGRAWQRTGTSDSPGSRSGTDAQYGMVADELDHPEVWDDWSGGFGEAYRQPGSNRYHWGENIDARFPRQLIHAQLPRTLASVLLVDAGDVLASLNVNGNSFCDSWAVGTYWSSIKMPQNRRSILLAGRGYYVHYLPTDPTLSNSDFVIDAGAASVLNGSGQTWAGKPAPELGGRLVSLATVNLIPNLNGSYGLSFQKTPAISMLYMYATGFVVAGDQLWKTAPPIGEQASSATLLQNCDIRANPLATANWGATYNLGTGGWPITDIAALNDQVFVSTAGGLHAGDTSGTFMNVLADAALQINPENGKEITVWQNGVVYPHIAGLWYFDANSGAALDISPPPPGKNSPLAGRFLSVRGHGQWLLTGIFTGSTSHLLMGRKDDSRGMVWHSMNRLPGVTKIKSLFVDGAIYASNNALLPTRLWMATDADVVTNTLGSAVGTAPVYWMPIPPEFGNPLAPSMGFSAWYCGSARIDLGETDWDAPSTPKQYRAVEVWAEALASGAQWCDVYYTIDGGTRTKLGTVAKSPKDTLYFPHSEASPFITGQAIALSIESFTASPGITPIYRSIVLRGALRPRSIDQVTAVVRIADGMVDRQGTRMRPGATMLKELRALATTSAPVRLVDVVGASSWVNVLAPVGESETYQEGDDWPEIAATVKLAITDFEG